MHLQTKPHESITQCPMEPLRVALGLETDNKVVSIPHHDNISRGMVPTPMVCPEVERVVQIHIRQ
jgi:hypothetical protein